MMGNGVVPCNNGTYCCYDLDRSECCSTASLVFSLGSDPVTIQTTLPATTIRTTPTASVSLPTSSSVLSYSTSSTTTETSPSSAATVVPPSSSARPKNNHVSIGVGIGVGVPLGLAILAGLLFMIRRRSNISDGRRKIQAYPDKERESNVNQTAELQHSTEHTRVELG